MIDYRLDFGKIVGDHKMNVDIIKTSDNNGAVFFKYQTSKISPIYEVTLPFVKNEQGLIKFNMSENMLYDLVKLIQHNLRN